jgi:hypothetical protein
MDAPIPGLVYALCGIAGLLLLVAAYLLGKDAGVRQERGEWMALLLVAWVAGREKRN